MYNAAVLHSTAYANYIKNPTKYLSLLVVEINYISKSLDIVPHSTLPIMSRRIYST